MDEANLTRRDALARAGKVALGSALLAGPLGAAALAEPAKATTGCHESTKKIISIAAVAEALAVTFYYNGITRKVGALITDEQLDYLRAALAQEKHHLELLRGAGVAQPPHTFYFDPATFMQVKHFTDVLDTLEIAFIGAYAGRYIGSASSTSPSWPRGYWASRPSTVCWGVTSPEPRRPTTCASRKRPSSACPKRRRP